MRFNPADYANKQELKTASKYLPIPNGWYKAIIKDVSIKTWDNPSGVSIQLTWQITEGEHKNRLHWQTLNVEHSDQKRELRSRYMLADVCRSVGYEGDLGWDTAKPPRQLVGYGCEIELVTLAAQPPKFPEPKNWLSSVRVPVDDGVEQSQVEKHIATFDDDDVPF
jgi:hypothetical protein